MKKVLVSLAIAAAAWAADTVQKIVPIRNADARQVFVTARDVMRGAPVTVLSYQKSIVLSGPQDAVATAEQLIKSLDVAPAPLHDIEVIGYIVMASPQATQTGAMPPDLEPVLRQFHNVLTYKSFRILDTIILRAREQQMAESSGVLPLNNSTYRFLTKVERVTDDSIHFSHLDLHVNIPQAVSPKGEVAFTGVNIGTDAQVKAGQKVAIGKASVDKEGDALILVISAKVVD